MCRSASGRADIRRRGYRLVAIAIVVGSSTTVSGCNPGVRSPRAATQGGLTRAATARPLRPSGTERVIGVIALRPAGRADAHGLAIIAAEGGRTFVEVQAQLPRSNDRDAYSVWLYHDPRRRNWLGAQISDAAGGYMGVGPLPPNYREYRDLELTRAQISPGIGRFEGRCVLRGHVADLRPPPRASRLIAWLQEQAASVGLRVASPPAPSAAT